MKHDNNCCPASSTYIAFHIPMGESSSPEVPKQRKKTLGPAPALQDSSSPALARRFKVKRIVSPSVPAQSAPAATGRKGKTKRSVFVKNKLFDHQCTEVGKSDGSASNSSDDGDESDLSCVSAGQNHPNADRFEYLQGLGSQSNMPPPLQATRFIEEDRSPLADRIEKRILAQRAERRANREADLAKVRLAALARKALSPISCSADVLANLLSPTRPTLPEAAMADLPLPPVTTLPHEAAVADLHPPPLSVMHEVVDVPSHSPLRHPFFGSLTRRPLSGLGVMGVSSNSAITFSAVRVMPAVNHQLPSPSNTPSMLPMQPDKPRHARLKLKKGLGPSKPPPSAAACPTSHLAYPPPKLKEAPSEPKTPSKTPSKLIPAYDLIQTPSQPVNSPVDKSLSGDKSLSRLRLNLHSSPPVQELKQIICLSQELELLAVDDSPVSRLEAFRALMASKPGLYRFSTGTQMDQVQQHSRETQTSPLPGLTIEDLRNELGNANRSLLMAFGF